MLSFHIVCNLQGSLRGGRSKEKGEGEFEREARSWGWAVGGELWEGERVSPPSPTIALRARTPLLPSPSNAGHASYLQGTSLSLALTSRSFVIGNDSVFGGKRRRPVGKYFASWSWERVGFP